MNFGMYNSSMIGFVWFICLQFVYIMSNYLQKGRMVCKKKKYLLPSTKELKKEEKKDEDQKRPRR